MFILLAAALIEPSSLIRQHYALYQTKHKASGINVSGGIKKTAVDNDASSLSMDSIQVGNDFSAVVGSFDAEFTQYLHELDDIDYVESNQIYHVAAAVNPRKRDQQVQSPVPNWGIARISHRDKENLNSNLFDDSIQG